MALHFDSTRMQQVINNHALWWKGELDRPLTAVTILDAHEPVRECSIPTLSQSNCHDLSVTPEEVIEAWDVWLSRQEYYGDAYPRVSLEVFGPGVLAAFCGAKLDNSSGAVWFFPAEQKPISEIHAVYDPNNKWSKRVKDICRAGIERWGDSVIIGFPDFGGNMDVAASLVGTEELLFACMEEPEEVVRLCKEIETAWFEAYEDFAEILKPQGCFSDWHSLLSREPAYVLQDDFTAMISPDMFKEFALEPLRSATERLTNTVYHLDGPGEIGHLDHLLTLKDLNAVQWVYGDGQPSAKHWIDLYKKIIAAGKGFTVIGGPQDLLDVLEALPGTHPYSIHYLSKDDEDVAIKLINAR